VKRDYEYNEHGCLKIECPILKNNIMIGSDKCGLCDFQLYDNELLNHVECNFNEGGNK
jgi:hypothetical protein